MENIKNIVIPEQYKMLLDNLKEAEGGYLHRNTKELDITTGWGIYKGKGLGKQFTQLWKYIDSLAIQVTNEPSDKWTEDICEQIDSLMDKDIEEKLSYLFYKDYFKGAHLELFHKDLVIMMSNLYANTQIGAWESVQEALRDVSKQGYLDIPLKELSGVDGGFGKMTKDGLNRFMEIVELADTITNIPLGPSIKMQDLLLDNFKKSALLHMKSYYGELAFNRQDTMLVNLPGWNNRELLPNN